MINIKVGGAWLGRKWPKGCCAAPSERENGGACVVFAGLAKFERVWVGWRREGGCLAAWLAPVSVYDRSAGGGEKTGEPRLAGMQFRMYTMIDVYHPAL